MHADHDAAIRAALVAPTASSQERIAQLEAICREIEGETPPPDEPREGIGRSVYMTWEAIDHLRAAVSNVGGPVMSPTSLTAEQKLQALAYRFYQGAKWEPKAGDYYTTSRADLELYQVVDVRDGKVFTRYLVGSDTIAEWDASEFLADHTFGRCRVFVPAWVLAPERIVDSSNAR